MPDGRIVPRSSALRVFTHSPYTLELPRSESDQPSCPPNRSSRYTFAVSIPRRSPSRRHSSFPNTAIRSSSGESVNPSAFASSRASARVAVALNSRRTRPPGMMPPRSHSFSPPDERFPSITSRAANRGLFVITSPHRPSPPSRTASTPGPSVFPAARPAPDRSRSARTPTPARP